MLDRYKSHVVLHESEGEVMEYLILWGLIGLLASFGVMLRYIKVRGQLDLIDVTLLPLFAVVIGPCMILILIMMVGEDIVVWRKK